MRTLVRSRSIVLATSLLMLLSVLLAACGGAAATNTPVSPSGDTTAATATTGGSGAAAASSVDWANDAAWHEPGEKAVGQDTAKSLNLGINTVMFPSTDAFQAAVKSSVTTDKAFPLFDWWFSYRMKDLVDSGLAADVTDIWKKHIDAGEYPASLMNSFGFNGKAYAIPKLINYWVVFYNKKVFDANSLKPPTTWAEFMTVNDTLKSKGITPIGLDVTTCGWCSFTWFEELMIRTDPQLYQDLTAGKVEYNDPKVLAVMKTWQDMIGKGYFTKGGEITSDTSVNAFAQGNYAMLLQGDWWIANIEKAGMKPNEDYGIFVLPGITDAGSKALIIEGRPLVVAEKSANKADALKIADYFMSTEGQTTWATTSKINSPNLKVADSTRPAILAPVASDVKAGKYELYTRYWEATPSDIVDGVVAELSKFVLHPDQLDQAMNNATTVADKYWAAHK